MNRDSQRLRLVLVVLLLISFTLITLDYKSDKFGGLRRTASTVFGPVERGIGSVLHPIGSFFGGIGGGSDASKVRSLQDQVNALRRQLRGAGDITRENAELNKLVTLAGSRRFTMVPARVISLGDLSGFDRAATINVGSRDGITLDQTVINGDGLVGRVVTVAPFSSQIALITDPRQRVSSRLVRTSAFGITSGHGDAPLSFEGRDPAVRPRKGDAVETYGSKTFAPGIPIGRVTSVGPTPGKTTLTAQLDDFVNFSALDVVAVVVQRPRTTLVSPTSPPLPTVTVTVTPSTGSQSSPTGAPAQSPASSAGG